MPDALPVTDRLRSAFAQRIERLPEPTRAALLIAAAEEAGELAVTLRAAAELGLPPDALDPAEEAGLLRTDGAALSFRHPLVRSVVYESVPLGRRRRTHAALAVALADEQHAERAVWHRAMATLTADEEVADALEASGQRSPAARRSRLGRDCLRASRDAQRGHSVTRAASSGGGRCRLVQRRRWTGPGSS